MASIVFVLFGSMPLVLNDSELLCLFFSLGCLLDSLFVSVRYYYDVPLTLASVKDLCGVIGMFFFTLVLACPVTILDQVWQSFFYLAFLIDMLSVLSVSSVTHNIYSFRVVHVQ